MKHKLFLILIIAAILFFHSCWSMDSPFGDVCNNCAGSGIAGQEADGRGRVCGACGGSGVMRIQTWPKSYQ